MHEYTNQDSKHLNETVSKLIQHVFVVWMDAVIYAV